MSVKYTYHFVKEIIGVLKPLLLDEGPILQDEAEFVGRALIEKFLKIIVMRGLFTCPIAPLSGPTRLVDPNWFRDARLIFFIYFSFIYFCLFLFIFVYFCLFFCKSVATRIPGPTQMADPNQSPVYSDFFHLSYQNILFMSFHFRVFNYVEVFHLP